ncbi:hypothetical protein M2401_005788 [Pseudomonas sp. JUb42]|nr:hypothetical protein [Pseudomonas sp. JUb42]
MRQSESIRCYSARRTSPLRPMLAALCGLAATVLALHTEAGTIEAINHTHWAINRFSVDDRSGIDIIGPWQGGGGGCCYIAPKRWQPGMTVRVDWETGSAYTPGFPGFADEAKYFAWVDKVEAQTRKHTKEVAVPDYTDQKVCGITVHFLPCDELEVTTSCYAYGSPDYPIKTPLRLPEPQSCPQPESARVREVMP